MTENVFKAPAVPPAPIVGGIHQASASLAWGDVFKYITTVHGRNK